MSARCSALPWRAQIIICLCPLYMYRPMAGAGRRGRGRRPPRNITAARGRALPCALDNTRDTLWLFWHRHGAGRPYGRRTKRDRNYVGSTLSLTRRHTYTYTSTRTHSEHTANTQRTHGEHTANTHTDVWARDDGTGATSATRPTGSHRYDDALIDALIDGAGGDTWLHTVTGWV